MLRGILMALGLYTIIPGFSRWDEKSRGWLAPMLPLIGVLLGLVQWGLSVVAQWYLPRLLGAVLAAITLPLLTGFLHLDGFMDVADALLSGRPRKEKLQILKDPLVGSFSVIALAILLMLDFAAMHGVFAVERPLITLLWMPILSRTLAALALMSIAPLPGSEYGRMHHSSATLGKRLWCLCCLAAVLILAILGGWRVMVSCLFAILGFALPCWIAVRQLGGMNGDIAGWSICLSEACCMIALACV